jgi:hypothetical protein
VRYRWFLVFFGAVLVVPLQADTFERNRELMRYFLWQYRFLEGAYAQQQYAREWFDQPLPDYLAEHPLARNVRHGRAMEVRTRLDAYETDLGIANIPVGPLFAGGSVLFSIPVAQPLLAVEPLASESAGFLDPTYLDYLDNERGQTIASQLYPTSGFSVSLALRDIVSVTYRQESRRFMHYQLEPGGVDANSSNQKDPVPVALAVEQLQGESLRVQISPSRLLPVVPGVNVLDSLSFELLSRDLEPDGYVVTNLFRFRGPLRTQLFLQYGRSEVTDLEFGRIASYLVSGFLLYEIDLVSRGDAVQRQRYGVSLFHLLQPRQFTREWSESQAFFNQDIVVGFYPIYERLRRPEGYRGFEESVLAEFAGFTAHAVTRFPRGDFFMDWSFLFRLPWSEAGTVWGSPLYPIQGELGLGRIAFEFRRRL